MNKKSVNILLIVLFSLGCVVSCTKVEKGFLSPAAAYSVAQFSFVQGRVATSYAMVPDGSTTPISTSILHVYDSATGNVMDAVFFKKYPVGVWNARFDPVADTTLNQVLAKRIVDSLAPITINESSGAFSSNSASLFVPAGTYYADVQVKNVVGTEVLQKAMKIVITKGTPLETEPLITGTGAGTGAVNLRNDLGNAGTNNTYLTFFNAVNNPFNKFTITRLGDTPNSVTLIIRDKNGTPLNPKKGEYTNRPNSGLNPVPAFLQSLQSYALGTYAMTDTSISISYPVAPFPIAPVAPTANGFNLYYDIPSNVIHIDSTTTWAAPNTAGVYYKPVGDSHYKGVYKDGLYDYFLRIPLRIQVPGGAFVFDVTVLNITHR